MEGAKKKDTVADGKNNGTLARRSVVHSVDVAPLPPDGDLGHHSPAKVRRIR
jgi:hypothetical protein